MDAVIRNVTTTDLPRTLRLNDCAVPPVNRISEETFSWFHGAAPYFKVAECEGQVEAFLIALDQTNNYDSPNFRYFLDRYDRFVYVDRIVVAQSLWQRGIGSDLYRNLAQFTRDRAPRITCEVNTRPANDGSLLFHQRHGFRQVGTQDTEGGTKSVALLVKELI